MVATSFAERGLGEVDLWFVNVSDLEQPRTMFTVFHVSMLLTFCSHVLEQHCSSSRVVRRIVMARLVDFRKEESSVHSATQFQAQQHQ